MKLVILAVLATLATARPDHYGSDESSEEAKILRHDFDIEDDGTYAAGVETSNSIVFSDSGSASGAKSGYFSWISPEGSEVHVKYVADENGYQPESSWLPVAPEFPHPIPQFVLDQIAKAAEEDADRARSAPSSRYGAPDDDDK